MRHLYNISKPVPAAQAGTGSLEFIMILLAPFLMLYSVFARIFPNAQKDYLDNNNNSQPPEP